MDTEGDSFPVSSRAWTYLYVKDRESEDPCMEIQVNEADGAIFNVQSESLKLEELAALYLFLTCGGSISSAAQVLDEAAIRSLCEKYSVELGRARSSIWQLSTDEPRSP